MDNWEQQRRERLNKNVSDKQYVINDKGNVRTVNKAKYIDYIIALEKKVKDYER